MQSTDADESNGLTTFALSIYGDDGVSAACLALQERHGLDVNLLLFAAYVGRVTASALSEADAARAHRQVAKWHEEVVRPLRAVRRRLKAGPAPAPDKSTDSLREKVKSVELQAELIELGQLDQLAADLTRASAPGDPKQRAASALETVVREMSCHDLSADDRTAIATIAAASARFGA